MFDSTFSQKVIRFALFRATTLEPNIAIPKPSETLFAGFILHGLGLGAQVSIGIMEKKMETTIVYWGFLGRMENQMETTIV